MPPTLITGEGDEDRLRKRIFKILDTRLDAERDTLEALEDCSKFFGDNTLQNRRNLRSQIERRSVSINEDFLVSLREVKKSLDGVCKDLDALTDTVHVIKGDLETSKALTQELIKQTNNLQEKRDCLQLQTKVAEVFCGRFQLSVHEHHEHQIHQLLLFLHILFTYKKQTHS